MHVSIEQIPLRKAYFDNFNSCHIQYSAYRPFSNATNFQCVIHHPYHPNSLVLTSMEEGPKKFTPQVRLAIISDKTAPMTAEQTLLLSQLSLAGTI